MANHTGKGTFKKNDPRINKLGRPKDFNAFRELAVEIAHEKAKNKDGTIVIDGHTATISEVILRSWAQSKDARLQQAFVAYAYGKVPDVLQGAGKDGELVIKVKVKKDGE
jgi:hypothetical protein